jgi:hypothetical protein
MALPLANRAYGRDMDRLTKCMDALRALSLQTADPNWYPLAEREIVRYLSGADASLQSCKRQSTARPRPPNTTLCFGPQCRSL